MGAFLVLLAVKYTGLGQALVVPPAVQQEEPSPAPQSPGLTDYERATVQVVEKVGPSVVMITTTSMVEVKDFFFGLVGYQPVQGLGSV